eukprot:TRINITY_DN8369_c0_g1_i4.p1 TRINITY_DN8369_c0_g1~~TRINITY_DN8369_c0_g1_i4.p1  ORF type:complete len:151 (+),score=17.54 TRINITY_DN8369_c0_g1_i4:101-553(+)
MCIRDSRREDQSRQHPHGCSLNLGPHQQQTSHSRCHGIHSLLPLVEAPSTGFAILFSAIFLTSTLSSRHEESHQEMTTASPTISCDQENMNQQTPPGVCGGVGVRSAGRQLVAWTHQANNNHALVCKIQPKLRERVCAKNANQDGRCRQM